MRRYLNALVLLAGLALLAGPAVRANDTVTYLDRYKSDKDKKTITTTVTGTITDENASRILLKATIGSVPAADVVDVFYYVPLEVRTSLYRPADKAELAANNPATKAADRKKALQEALAGYRKLQSAAAVKSNKFLQRHLQYKIARLTARLAGDDKAMRKTATDLLLKFKADHPNSWQIIGCLEKLADLQQEAGDFKGAAEAFDAMAKMKELSPDTRKKCQLAAAQALIQAGDHLGAAARLSAILDKGLIKKDDPQYFRLQMTQAQCQASQKDQVGKAIANLNQIVAGLKENDHLRKAIALNTLGDCYLAANRPKDALYAYLNVDLYYNSDRDEHRKACTQLVKLFEKLRDKERVKDFQEKLNQLKN